MTNIFSNLKPGDPEPDFVFLSQETNKPVSQLRREYAVMLAALSGKVPAALTEAREAKKRAADEVARADAAEDAAIRLYGEWESLLARRVNIAREIERAQTRLAQINTSDAADAAIDNMITDGSHITVLFAEIMKLIAMPAVKQKITGLISRKTAELVESQKDVEAFAALHKITL
jgi:hypothetical protein